MRICILGRFPDNRNSIFTGPMRVIYSVVQKLKLDNNVIVFSSPYNHLFKKMQYKKFGSLIVYQLNPFTLLLTVFRNDCDVFHIFSYSYFYMIPLLFRKLINIIIKNGVIIYTAHGLLAYEKDMGYKALPIITTFYERLLFKLSDHITTVSTDLKNMIVKTYNVSPAKITVIPNGVDKKFFREIDPKPFLKDFGLLNKKVILFVGTIEPVKGLDFLLGAIRLIKQELKRDNWAVILLGPKTKNLKQLEKLYSDLFSEKVIISVGSFKDKMLLSGYASADIFILPSKYESFGLVALEAMAIGKPIIISDKVGMKPCITQGKNGFIVPCGDTNGLANKLLFLIKNESERNRIGRNAKVVAKKFDWKYISNCYVKLYGQLLRGKK